MNNLTKGLFKENPVLVLLLGMCPSLATTTSVINALGMGLSTALAYGILQLIIDPYIISLPQMLIDYLFAFGALGLSGLFYKSKNSLIKGYLFGVFGRYLFSFLSGWIFFATYTPEFFNSAAIYSLAYNGAYLGAEALITLILISLPPVNRALSQVKKAAVN